MDEPGPVPIDVEGRPALRRANLLVVIAFLLAVTSLFLPWWSLQASFQGVTGELVPSVGLWSPNPEVARGSWVVVSLGAVLLACVVLFFLVTGASWKHEPKRFRLLALACGALLLFACLVAFAWPVEFPFWGTRGYLVNGTSEASDVIGMPVLGWWLAALAGAALVGASAMSKE